MSYHLAKFQFCRLLLASIIDSEKHNDDVIMASFHVVEI